MIKAIAFLQSALCISIMLLSGFNAKAQINPIKFEEYDLPNGWRLIYTIESDDLKIMNIILEWFSHKDYERRFNY